MKIFVFDFINAHLGAQSVKVLAEDREQALELLRNDTDISEYINDEFTNWPAVEYTISLDEPKIISSL